MDSNWLKNLFINEAKPALSRHSGSGGGGGDTGTDELETRIEELEAELANSEVCVNFYNARTNNGTDCSNLFSSCTSLTTAPLFDTSSATNLGSMFNGCASLATVPLYDTSSATNMGHMFYKCASLTTVPLFDTSSVTTMGCMFQDCTSLTTVPLFDTSSVTTMGSMLNNCKSLTTAPPFDIRSATAVGSMFAACRSLTECWLRNISANLQVGSGASYGNLLTTESLIHLIRELRNVGSARQLTIGTANLEKLANTYVRLIDITDEMRAEDDLIDEKLPFEVCESTDDGAVLITDYALEKKWTIL